MVANVVANAAGAPAGAAGLASEAEQTVADSFLQALAGLLAPAAPPQAATAKPALPGPDEQDELDADADANVAAANAVDPSLLMILQAQTNLPNPEIKPCSPPATSVAETTPADASVESAVTALNTEPPLPLPTAVATSSAELPLPEVANVDLPKPAPETPNPDLAKSNFAPLPLPNAASSKAELAAPKKEASIDQSDQSLALAAGVESSDTLPSLKPPGKGKEKGDQGMDLLSTPAVESSEMLPTLKPPSKSEDKSDKATEFSSTPAANKVEVEFKSSLFVPVNEPGAVAATSGDANAASNVSTAAITSAGATPTDIKPTDDKLAQAHLHARVGTAAWREELGTQVNWMVDNGKHSASLKLSPEHLGPVEVRIDINQDQASVWFSATHTDTRNALEQALPRLREMLAAQGMSLNDAGVSREPPREQGRSAAAFNAGTSSESGEEQIASVRSARLGLLDTYA